jgi:broad specificity phosphatase PhoE
MLKGIPDERLIILVRHAESEKNIQDYHGHSEVLDHPLTAPGLVAAQKFGLMLRERVALAGVFSSGSLSPTQTADAIAKPHGITAQVRQGLHAVDMGILSGLTDAQVAQQYPEFHEELRRFQAGLLHPKDMTIPGREEFSVFAMRVFQELCHLKNQCLPLLVVGHHSSLSMILHVLASQPPKFLDAPYRRYRFPHLSSTLLEARIQNESGWELRQLAVPPDELMAD